MFGRATFTSLKLIPRQRKKKRNSSSGVVAKRTLERVFGVFDTHGNGHKHNDHTCMKEGGRGKKWKELDRKSGCLPLPNTSQHACKTSASKKEVALQFLLCAYTL